MMKTLSILLFCFIILRGNGQTLNERRLEFCAIDMCTAGLIGGIGSLVHKNGSDKNWKVFLKGFRNASLGGFISFIGKDNSIQVRNGHWGYAWIDKSLSMIGSSVIENIAGGNKLFSNLGLDYGFIRVDINKRVRARVQPFSLAGFATCMVLTHGNLSVKESLMYGSPTFISDSYVAGAAIMNNIMIDKNTYHNATAGHELIHTYQYRESFAITNIYLKNSSKYVYWDMPNFLPTYGISAVGSILKGDYYYNYYEWQAEGLSNKLLKP